MFENRGDCHTSLRYITVWLPLAIITILIRCAEHHWFAMTVLLFGHFAILRQLWFRWPKKRHRRKDLSESMIDKWRKICYAYGMILTLRGKPPAWKVCILRQLRKKFRGCAVVAAPSGSRQFSFYTELQLKSLKKILIAWRARSSYETCFVISFLINHKTGSAFRRCLPD